MTTTMTVVACGRTDPDARAALSPHEEAISSAEPQKARAERMSFILLGSEAVKRTKAWSDDIVELHEHDYRDAQIRVDDA
jgi:hypothetical protein